MKITLVEPQKNNPRRFNIYLDGQFAFGADEDTIVDFRLVPEKEITKEILDKLLSEVEVGKLMERMYRLFNVRLRSEREIRDYLRRLSFKRKIKEREEISELVIENLIEKLKRKGLINDAQFALRWTESRRRSKKKGINVIRQELFQKGINREIIEDIINRGDHSSERKLAEETLQRRIRRLENLEPVEFKKKAIEFLMRRGFEFSLAKEVVEKLDKKG